VTVVSFLLVFAGAGALILGLSSKGATLIYVSIGCSIASALILAVAWLLRRSDDQAVDQALAPPLPESYSEPASRAVPPPPPMPRSSTSITAVRQEPRNDEDTEPRSS
jgi:hypothetical protein